MNQFNEKERITIALSGASGAQYGLRLIEYLVTHNYPVNVLISKAAKVVLALEMDIAIGNSSREQRKNLMTMFSVDNEALIHVYSEKEWIAPFASGSNTPDYMVVCPCSMGMLAAISTGQSNNLIERAADVVIKEKRHLILVVRETPFSQIHLKNMLSLSQLGVQIMPANPGFYHKPSVISDIIDFMVARILDQLNIPHDLMIRWGEKVTTSYE